MNKPKKAHPNFHPTQAHKAILHYVQNNPGCNKFQAVSAGVYNPRRNASHHYYLVNTLIRHGYVIAEYCRNAYKLYWWEDKLETKLTLQTENLN